MKLADCARTVSGAIKINDTAMSKWPILLERFI
jgi:hypothetical protein